MKVRIKVSITLIGSDQPPRGVAGQTFTLEEDNLETVILCLVRKLKRFYAVCKPAAQVEDETANATQELLVESAGHYYRLTNAPRCPESDFHAQ